MHTSVCVSYDSKSFPALHLIPRNQVSAQSRSRCLLPRRRWDTTASPNQTNLPCQLILATNFCSVATIHLPILSTWLAGIVLQGEHSLAQQKVVLRAQKELGKHGPKTSNLNHDLMGTKAYVPQKEGESGMAENSKASIPSAGGKQREAA